MTEHDYEVWAELESEDEEYVPEKCVDCTNEDCISWFDCKRED